MMMNGSTRCQDMYEEISDSMSVGKIFIGTLFAKTKLSSLRQFLCVQTQTEIAS